ncbi:2'-5'-oligoadenylate synthase 3 [Microtus ochrogaster]|uniref:2'-5'-oligoadenylate synthase 3 n=1 Tax=Microtus ochrogaster TaxID=79684 RepID=A0A8J6GTG6_MICOH|nr:2'-5'-oligoadenylate synthase 3 [Microtus ochrogaster]
MPLQGRSDADLIVFLSCFRQLSEQGSHWAEVISEIRAQLEACQQKQKFNVKFENSNKKKPQVLSFSLTSQTLLDQSVDFEVLPAFNALACTWGTEEPRGHDPGPCSVREPIILDPADPTGNLGHNAHWDLLAQDAAACTSALCCMDKDGTPIKP